MKNLFAGLRKNQKVASQTKPEQKSEKQVSFAELIDDCIKLVQMPNRVDVDDDHSYLMVYQFGNPQKQIFCIFEFVDDKYLITFSLDAWYYTSEFGEVDRVKKLYNLCLDKAKETKTRRSLESLAEKRANLTKTAQSIKQYM